jgi:hypothetical protein
MRFFQAEIIRCAVQERTVALHPYQGGVMPVQTPEWNLVHFLMEARELTASVTRSQAELFRIASRSGEAALRPTDLGKRFLSTVVESVRARSLLRPGHKVDPLVSLLFEECDRRGIGMAWVGGGPRSADMMMSAADSLNGCVNAIRRKAKRMDFKAKSNRWSEAVKNRFSELTSYFEALADAYPASRVARIDFSFWPTQWGLLPSDQGIDDAIAAQWRALQSHIAERIGPSMVGHAWKRDYGVTRGTVFHLVLVVDGPREHDLDALVQGLMWEWQARITGGQGICFNCLSAAGSPFSVRGGLPILEFHPGGLANVLHNAAAYLSLGDYVLSYDGAGRSPRQGQSVLPFSEQASGRERGPWPFLAS